MFNHNYSFTWHFTVAVTLLMGDFFLIKKIMYSAVPTFRAALILLAAFGVIPTVAFKYVFPVF